MNSIYRGNIFSYADLMKDSGSDSFCMMPWVSMQLHQNSKAYPCCHMNEKYTYGDLKNQKLSEVWNSKSARNLRGAMLRGENVPACQFCYDYEKLGIASPRKRANQQYASFISRVEDSAVDGVVKDSPVFLDLRFSNICNFKCRTCSFENSTSWHQEYKAIAPQNEASQKIIRLGESRRSELWKEIEGLLPNIKKIYFAGGEPLLEEDHYLLLEKIISLGRTDIELSYNTNLSHLGFKQWSIIDLWSHFKIISIGASLDGAGKQLELLRKGADWDVILNNFRKIKNSLSQVHFCICPTIGVMNAFHITTALKIWLDEGILTSDVEIELNYLVQPSYLDLNILNSSEREKLVLHYEAFKASLKERVLDANLQVRILNLIDGALQRLALGTLSDERARFRYFTLTLDRSRNENFVKLFPEFFDLIYGEAFEQNNKMDLLAKVPSDAEWVSSKAKL